jgi:hypothetical protein
VLRVEPLAVEDEAAVEELAQPRRVRRRPLLEEIEVPFARAAGQHVSAALQAQLAVGADRDAGVRAVELLLDDDVPALQHVERLRREVLVARLQPRALEVRRARVLVDRLVHAATIATATRCPRT